MKKKYYLVALLLMLVGFATVSTTLYLSGSTNIISSKDDFKVYYSDAKVNGVQDLSIVESETALRFSTELDTLGETYVIEYDVTNSSKNYDADLAMVCTGGDEYLSVVNNFDDVTNLAATETRVGTLTLTLAKTYTGADYDVDINCTITANAVERTSLGTGTPAAPVEGESPVEIINGDGTQLGDLVCIDTECFYVLENDGETASLLAMNVLNVGGTSTSTSYTPYETYTGIQDSGISSYIVIGGSNLSYENVIDFWYADDDDEYIEFYSNYIDETLGVPNTAYAMTNDDLAIVGCDVATLTCTNTPDFIFDYNYTTDGDYYADYDNEPIAIYNSGITEYDQEVSFVYGGYPELSVRPVIRIDAKYIR